MTDPSTTADLIETAGNPLPVGIRAGSVETPDRVRLRYGVAPSRLANTRGTVILLQGRGEAIEKYFETIDDLTALGYGVATFDWRGQGGSTRLVRNPAKGHVGRFAAYVADLECILRNVVLPDCRGPYVILAHSMGAAVALTAAPGLANRVERIVASAPMVALPEGGPDLATLQAGGTALRLLGLGGLSVRRERKPAQGWSAADNLLTSDARRFERNRQLMEAAPQLFAGSATAAWIAAAASAMRRFEDSDVVADFQIPTLIVTAGADRIVSARAAERLGWRMRSGHTLCLPGARHELLQEADRFRAPFLAAFDAFAGGAMPGGLS